MTQNQDWKLLYRVDAIAALVAAVLFRRNIGAELSLFIEAAPQSIAGWYTLLQTSPFIGLAYFAIFDLVNYFLVGLIFLALTVALWQRNKSLVAMALTGGLVGIFVLPGIAFILTLAFGFWVSHLGKPYNGLLFNVHKLIALGAVVATVIQLLKLLKGVDSLALVIVLLVVAALCVIALFASGALMSMGKLDYALMLTVHRVAPVALIIAMAIAIYMLKGA